MLAGFSLREQGLLDKAGAGLLARLAPGRPLPCLAEIAARQPLRPYLDGSVLPG